MDQLLDSPVIHINDTEIITKDDMNPTLSCPNESYDLSFYQTKETLMDPERYKSFLKNAERRFRASKEYKMYKSFLMGLGFDHCQIMGNIEADDTVDIELHHNILNLFDICILICEHVLNTVGFISTFDLIQLLIKEHFENRVGVVFLSSTAHEMFTNGEDSYIPPNMTFGRWWELLDKYKYGITYEIAQKLIRYSNKYQAQLPTSINIIQQEQILNFAYYNEYGIPANQLKQIEINRNQPVDDEIYF